MTLDARDMETMDDVQRVALLEMLVTGVLADGKVTAEEVARFDELVRDLPWGMEPDVLAAVIEGTQARVGALKTPEQIMDFIIGCAARVPTARLREKLVLTMMSVMSADREVDQRERSTLGMFLLAFGITSDRLAEMKLALAAHHARPA